jgi:hypothetical protein
MEFSKLILFCYVFCGRKVHRSHVGYLQIHAFYVMSLYFFIIIISSYSSVEHRARVKAHHLVLFAAKAFTSSRIHFIFFHIFYSSYFRDNSQRSVRIPEPFKS